MQITVYTTPACAQCEMTKKVLRRNGIKFDEIDVSTDIEALKEIQAMGFTQAPVVCADDKCWSGFRLDKLKMISDLLFGEKKIA